MQPYDKLTLEDEHERNYRVRMNQTKDYFTVEFKAQHIQSQELCIFLCSVKSMLYMHVHIICLLWSVISCVNLQGWIMNEAPGSPV